MYQMTASAHAFHHNLHVHFINGTRTYIYLIIVWSQHKRSLHAGDVQKLIGSLGSTVGLSRPSLGHLPIAKQFR